MNEHFALSRMTRIDLALEPPFALGRYKVVPAALEVRDNGSVETLEPRVMQVLVALFRGRGEPVSRDSLIDLCWQGRFVGEDALNRCIARVRKALAGDPGVRIDTIAKVGYRLRDDAPTFQKDGGEVEEPLTEAAPQAAAETTAAPRFRLGRPHFIAGGVAAALAVIAVAFVALKPPPAWSAEGFRHLTSDPGVETHPALSPSGDMLAYAAGPGGNAFRDLYLRGVEHGTPVRLTTNPLDDVAPMWSPDGSRLAFVRQDYRQPCRIIVTPVPSGAEREVGRCSLERSTRIGWLDARTVLISDRTAWNQPRRIRALDIENGYIRYITAPPAGILGDADPLPSPDGRKLVFRRSLAHGVDDLQVMDLRTGQVRPLTQDGFKAHGTAWAADGRHLFFASNRGGDFGLWVIDTQGGEPRRVSLGIRPFGRMSASATNRLAVEAGDSRVNLARIGPAGETPLTNTRGYDWDPSVAADGAVAFVSEYAGASDIWLLPPGGPPTRLTRLNASYVYGSTFSPDGTRVAFVMAKGRGSDLYAIARDGSQLRRYTSDGKAKVDPNWSADGRALIYASLGPNGWRLMRQVLGQRTATPVPGGEGWTSLRRGADGRLYGMRPGDLRLWTLPAEGGRPTIVPGVVFEDEYAWTVGRDGIYQIRGRRSGADTLWVRPYAGGEFVRRADIPRAGWRPAMAVSPTTGEVVMANWVTDDADLALIDLRR